MRFTLPPDVELTVDLDETPHTCLYLEQGTDVIQVAPKHIPAVIRAMTQAHDRWRSTQPVKSAPNAREIPTRGEA